MSKTKSTREELKRIYDEIAESIAEMSKNEIRDEFADVQPIAKKIFKAATEQVAKRRAQEARRRYEENVRASKIHEDWLPKDYASKQSLLLAALSRSAQLRSGVTAQFRDFEKMSDEDLDSALIQMKALGLID